MEWLTTELADKLLHMPYLVALGIICWVFLKIILGLIDVIKERKD